MSGDVPIELERQFLARHNHADLQVLKNIRATVEPRNRWAWGWAWAWPGQRGDGMTGRMNVQWLAVAPCWCIIPLEEPVDELFLPFLPPCLPPLCPCASPVIGL